MTNIAAKSHRIVNRTTNPDRQRIARHNEALCRAASSVHYTRHYAHAAEPLPVRADQHARRCYSRALHLNTIDHSSTNFFG